MVREQSFTAVIEISGVNPYVDVPPRVLKTFGGGAKVAVLVQVAAADATKKKSPGASRRILAKHATRLKAIGRLAAGGWFRSTLLALQSGAPRLYLDTWMRKTANVGVGDRVQVTLRPDRGSRELPMPTVLCEALDGNERAKAAWELLPPSRRREILTYLNFLKTRTALERNVQKTIAGLVAKKNPRG
ncbi:MAG: YdeI/OmpD-associated family protein [Gemmatimonadales bacterium]